MMTIFLLFVVAGQSLPAQPDRPVPPPQVLDYQLGPGDVVSIRVSGLREFDQRTRVSNSGRIRVPYVGVMLVTFLVPFVLFVAVGTPEGEDGSADMVVSFRSVHNWVPGQHQARISIKRGKTGTRLPRHAGERTARIQSASDRRDRIDAATFNPKVPGDPLARGGTDHHRPGLEPGECDD